MTQYRGNPLLNWLNEMLALVGSKAIVVPKDYRDQVILVKSMLRNDLSGLANTVLDLSINAALVDYTIESKSAKLNEIMANWSKNVNADLVGKIPRGIQALAKEYLRERWKGSSLLLLRTFWENVDGYKLPTTMYFADGEDIVVENKNKGKIVELGGWKYGLALTKKNTLTLPSKDNEKIFVQKPYESWSAKYPTPYLIQKGAYKNIKILELASEKGENLLAKALDYLLMIKKGDKSLVNNPDFVYSEEDLKKVKTDFKGMMNDSKSSGGTSTYTTNFDTDIEQIIPDYGKVVSQTIYGPIEKRILASLGLVEIVEGTSSSRKESILNPKPLVAEINSGVADFVQLLEDLIYVIEKENKASHKKFFNGEIKVRAGNVKEFLTDDTKTLLRGVYDRGGISKETFVDLVGDVDFALEVERRKQEKKDGLEVIMYPPVVMNIEKDANADDIDTEEENENKNKTSVEKKNFDKSSVEESLYTKKNFPDEIKNLPVGARSIWIQTFNQVFKDTKDETIARQSAWRNVILKYKKVNNKYVKKTKAEVDKSKKETSLEEIIELKKLEVLYKKNKLLDELSKEK